MHSKSSEHSEYLNKLIDHNAYHPALPSTQGAKTNYEMITSDHIPLLASIPCPDNEAGIQEIKIITWNVLENDGGNGFSEPNSVRMRYGESDEQRSDRHSRIAYSLAQFVKNYHPDFITLQEIEISDQKNPYSLFNIIKKQLGKSYGCVKVIRKGIEERKNSEGIFEEHEIEYTEFVDSQGCVTLYNKNLFKTSLPPTIKQKKDLIHAEMNGSITKFTSVIDPNFEVKISNAHHNFNEKITVHEKHIEDFLHNQDTNKLPSDKSKITVNGVFGDFNGSIASVDAEEENITTSVAPPGFRKDGLQGAWGIDGGFYSVNGGVCKQAVTQQLNPLTGKLYSKKELSTSQFDHLDDPKKKEVNRFRPIICVDEAYKTKKIIENHTIYSYEEKLRSEFGDNRIYVREARNLRNQAGISIIANKELGYHFTLLNAPLLQTSIHDDLESGQPFYCISTAANNSQQLNRLINLLIQHKDLYEFSQQLYSMQKKVTGEIFEKFKALFISFHDEKIDWKNPAYTTILKHITQEAEKLCVNPKPSFKEIEASAKQLQREIYGTPPLNPKIKALIFGIIGALVGAALGLVFGAAATFYAGGFGSFPAALLGAVKGFTVATAIATGGLTLGGIIGSVEGSLAAYRNRDEYIRNIKESKKELNEKILNEADAIYSNLIPK